MANKNQTFAKAYFRNEGERVLRGLSDRARAVWEDEYPLYELSAYDGRVLIYDPESSEIEREYDSPAALEADLIAYDDAGWVIDDCWQDARYEDIIRGISKDLLVCVEAEKPLTKQRFVNRLYELIEEPPVWYAVQHDPEDGWDYGSFDEDEARKMAKRTGAKLIAVIQIGKYSPECIDEFRFDE